MTAAEFAANLRSEMGRQGIDLQELLRRLSDARGDSEEPVPVGFNRAYLLCACNPEHLLALPTPAEIAALATALGCPEERLTVSREEMERRLADVHAECDHHAARASRLDCERTDLEYDCQALRARVAELETQIQACHEWADTNHCWVDIAEIFGPRKGGAQ